MRRETTIGQRMLKIFLAGVVWINWQTVIGFFDRLLAYQQPLDSGGHAAVAVITIIIVGGLPLFIAMQAFLIFLECMVRTFR